MVEYILCYMGSFLLGMVTGFLINLLLDKYASPY
jgi:hypothetical protein